LLQTILGWHLHGIKEAGHYVQEAITYSREAQDIPLLIGALCMAAYMHSYTKRYQQALHTIEQALPLLKLKPHAASPPPLVCADMYSTLALIQVKNGQEPTTSLSLAREALSAHLADEPRLMYMVDNTGSVIVANDAAAHYYRGKPNEALNALSQLIDLETLAPKMPMPERERIDVLNDMARAALKSENKQMERVIHFWQAALEGALKLHSELRFSEVLVTYEIMQSLWPTEKRITELHDLIVRW
jgi:tetratricopeptide (TPR) repeat protein